MSTNHDWLPSNHEALHRQSVMTVNYLLNNMMSFGIAGAGAEWVTAQLFPAQQAFAVAFAAWNNPSTRTPVITAELKTAESRFIALYRQLYTGYLKGNPAITDADMIAMGLPPHNTVDRPTPSPVPASYPLIDIRPLGVRTVQIAFHDSGTLKKARPRGVAGAVIRWEILPAPPASVAELTRSVFDTKTPCTLTFDEDRRGQTVYIVAAWQNTRGETGPWSEIVNAIIP
jgi:hypothetical protein